MVQHTSLPPRSFTVWPPNKWNISETFFLNIIQKSKMVEIPRIRSTLFYMESYWGIFLNSVTQFNSYSL